MALDFEKFSSSLLDVEVNKTKEEQRRQNALAIKNEIKRGSSPDKLANLFRYNQLKDALSYFKVPGRSELTRLKDMSIALVNKIGDDKITTGIGTKADVELGTLREQRMKDERTIANLEIENGQMKSSKKIKTKKKKKSKIKGKKYKSYLNDLLR